MCAQAGAWRVTVVAWASRAASARLSVRCAAPCSCGPCSSWPGRLDCCCCGVRC